MVFTVIIINIFKPRDKGFQKPSIFQHQKNKNNIRILRNYFRKKKKIVRNIGIKSFKK